MKPNRYRLIPLSLAASAALVAGACGQNGGDRVAAGDAPEKALTAPQRAPGLQANAAAEAPQVDEHTSEQVNKALAERVSNALHGTSDLNSETISVHADSGRIQLSGVVRSSEERLKAEQIAGAVPGVTAVSSTLAVGDEAPSS